MPWGIRTFWLWWSGFCRGFFPSCGYWVGSLSVLTWRQRILHFPPSSPSTLMSYLSLSLMFQVAGILPVDMQGEGCALAAQSCLTLCDPTDCSSPGSSVHEISPGKNTGVGCHSLLQRIFLTQGSNPGFLHCRQILCPGFADDSDGKEFACNARDPVRSLDREDPLEKGMATHSSILAWRIPMDRGT